ncbi:MAG: S46 family peptidase [Chlorobi bacterium]|nr:S46 family peptidase [Chlorobiota bacterium]
MKKHLSLFIGLLFAIAPILKADEGMWLLPLLEKLNIGTMTRMGLKLSAEDIYSANHSSLKDAIVIFGGGCTGEIVSDRGLLLTNHHCGFSSIQSHSTTGHNYLEDGYWAKTKEDELPNPGLSVTFLVRIEDVSDQILPQLSDTLTEEERDQKVEEISRELEKKATDSTNYEASVRSFFAGNAYYLLVYEIFKDVRFVGTPPSSIGKFGGDTDNWMWPRHTGDFSVFRVYMAPDGTPAEYDPENVPLKPKHYLPVSLKGVHPNDFTMVLGYPGGTQRYMTSYEIDELLKITHPNRILIRGTRQDILWKDMMASEKVRIQYASKYSGSSNYWKFSIGQSQGLKRLKIKDLKKAMENQFRTWVAADPQRQQKYGEALDLIKKAIEGRATYTYTKQYIVEALIRGSEIVSFAFHQGRLESALESGDQEKITKAVENAKSSAERFYKDYNPPTDRKAVKAMFKLFSQHVQPDMQPDVFVTISKKYKNNVDKYVDHMFDKSIFTDQNRYNAFLANPKLKTLQKDPAYVAAQSIIGQYYALSRMEARFDQDLDKGHRLYMAGLMEMQPDKVFYPDANFSMRLTYGTVGGYDPKDAVHYKYFTTLKGVMEKEDPNNYEFIVPDKLKELYKDKDFGRYGENGVMHVCFTTNNDITGGNSGSPVINGNGELLGLAFDGNWEAMSGDITFEPKLQKCIAVDIRYVLFIMDKFAGAKHIVDEMTLVE